MIAVSGEKIENLEKGRLGIHPLKLVLYGGMISMFMFFALTTSALLFKKGDVLNWEQFTLPNIFMVSTVLAIACSILIHFSMNLYKAKKFTTFRITLFISILLGIAFLATQVKGFQVLTAMGMPLDGNASGSFIYLIAIVHGLHMLFGLLFSAITFGKAVWNRKDPIYELRDIINPRRVLSLELLTTYWHFVDVLWVYLYIFLYVNY